MICWLGSEGKLATKGQTCVVLGDYGSGRLNHTLPGIRVCAVIET